LRREPSSRACEFTACAPVLGPANGQQARLAEPLRASESPENLGKERKAPVIAAQATAA
jgi:hypothetical protein